MKINKNKTVLSKSIEDIEWYIFDAGEYKLGRLTSKIASILTNKHKSNYLPYTGGQSNIIIINSKKIQVTGRKNEQKVYKRHSGRPGSMKVETLQQLRERIPNRIIESSLRGMLPKNSLGRKLFKKVKIYSSHEHPHQSQNPVKININ